MKRHIRRRGSKDYEVYDLEPDATGKRRQKWVPVEGNKRDAERKCAEIVNRHANGTYVEPSWNAPEELFRNETQRHAYLG